MSYHTYKKKMSLIQEYIKNKWADSPDKLADKLDVSRRTIFRMIAELKEDGIEIEYCKREKKYTIK